VIPLNDEPHFVDAIDCMVSYFSESNYDASKYTTSAALLHAQVAIMADKYDCASLYKLANISFTEGVNTIEGDDWPAIASLVYKYTTTDIHSHKEMRGVVVTAAINCLSTQGEFLQMKGVAQLLRINADLATDFLMAGHREWLLRGAFENIAVCTDCHYVHAGPINCARLNSAGFGCDEGGPRHNLILASAVVCSRCGGYHTEGSLQDYSSAQSLGGW
jgi:hypothetical protein